MGLDMYLYAECETFSTFGSDPPSPLRAALLAAAQVAGLPGTGASDKLAVTREVARWLKANAVHAWFVRECQGGVDDCRYAPVAVEQLRELHQLCTELLAQPDEDAARERLPPQSGLFFGGTGLDGVYWGTLEQTVAQLQPLLALEYRTKFYYRSSW